MKTISLLVAIFAILNSELGFAEEKESVIKPIVGDTVYRHDYECGTSLFPAEAVDLIKIASITSKQVKFVKHLNKLNLPTNIDLGTIEKGSDMVVSVGDGYFGKLLLRLKVIDIDMKKGVVTMTVTLL